jgi:hypothetical protein
MGGARSTHGKDEERRTKSKSENMKGKDHSEDLGVDVMIKERILGEKSEKVWIGFIWLRRGTSYK